MSPFNRTRSKLTFFASFLLLLSCNEPQEKKEIKLVLQITVDGLRADLLERYIEDPIATLLATRQNNIKSAQVDPAQKASRTGGRSPIAILAETFSDEIYRSGQGKAKVFAVSGKDRGAVPMAGHKGKSFWFSTDNGDFISSKFYFEEFPKWVKNWNTLRKA